MVGLRFGKIVVVEYAHAHNGAYWRCACDCGGVTIVKGYHLRAGMTKSCGCGARAQAAENCRASARRRAVPHAYSRKLKDLYGNMIRRCFDPKNKRWAEYGGRGITVCELWLNDRRGFYDWAVANGWQPGLQIDRINNDGGYEPGNCRFVDGFVQANNTRKNTFLEWNGRRLTVSQWAREIGVMPKALQHRVDRGWDNDRIFTQPYRGAVP